MTQLSRRTFLAWLSAAFPAFAASLQSDRAVSSRAPARGWFTDVAGRSSFGYRTNNNFTGRKYFPQPMCGGVAAIDYNNDGLVDLFFTNGAKLPELEKTSPAYYNCLLHNNGDGTFDDVTSRAGLTGADLGYC